MTHFTDDEIRAGNANLLKLAAILDTADAEHEAKGEPTYSQTSYDHKCGTPACAAGHWRAAMGRVICGTGDRKQDCADFALDDSWGETAEDETEWEELFSVHGCGDAQTAREAADFLRAFVSRRASRVGAGE